MTITSRANGKETSTMKYRLLTLAISIGLCTTANAAMRHYNAPIESSQWVLKTDSKLQCALEHNVPGYGVAIFSSVASKQLNMLFDLDMKLLPKHFDTAAVYSVPPSWMPGKAQRKIADMTLRAQYDGDLPEKVAWTMLSELEKGFRPTLHYQDWYNDNDKVVVSLNASNFYDTYTAFTDCITNLLPYSFEDIAYTVLTYESNSIDLTRYSQKQLNRIGEYLKADNNLELVLVDGYSDAYGARYKNQQLSVERAETIKGYFVEMGVEGNRIDVTGHGERRHISPNDTPEARAKNRRVVVQLSRS